VPQCAFHPAVETSVRCVECDRYICSKDMVSTPVGYKCRECGAPAAVRLGGVKPQQYALALVYGLGAGIVGGLVVGQLLAMVHFGLLLFDIIFGAAIAEATRRGAGGHRTPPIAAIAGAGAALGALAGGFGLFGVLLAGGAAVFTVLSNRF
jgi:hypothetical protein